MQTDLNVLWEVTPFAQDKMSTSNRAEASSFPLNGQVYYAPKYSSITRRPLNRLYNQRGDHMDSLLTNEGGYTFEGALGYPWRGSSRPAGTASAFRGWNPSNSDHALMSVHLAFPGYNREGFTDAYAYHRFGRTAPLFALSGSQVTVKSNLAAGGSIWEYWWNGKQFVDHLDYGREIQSSLSFTDSDALPTEGGDSTATGDPNYMHGAPIVRYTNTITDKAKTQSTRAVPLEWNHTSYNGNLQDVPVAYTTWQLGKDITLDDSSIDLGSGFQRLNGQVARYETVLSTPVALANADIEIPTAYLLPEFRRGFTFNATEPDINAAAHEVRNSEFTHLGSNVYHLNYNAPSGGVIYANQSLAHAIGVYGSTPGSGGSARYFTLWKFGSLTAPSVTKWSAGGGITTLTPGDNRFRTWIVVGTYDDVRVAMRRLYIQGYR